MKKRNYLIIFISLILFLFLITYFLTGIFQLKNIDERDLEHWEYENGLIKNAEEFSIEGNQEVCWLLIHSYLSTPAEMKNLANEINKEFNDSVKAIRLEGHGEVPSKAVNLDFNDWYIQAEKEFEELNKSCTKINLVGNSLGGALVIKLAEEKDTGNIFLLNTFLKPVKKWYYIFPLRFYLEKFSDILLYEKKYGKITGINSPEGLKLHITYKNFLFQPIKNSLKELDNIVENSNKITEPVLIIHSINDEVADFNTLKNLKVKSEIKEIVELKKSNHILLLDYEKDIVISSIIEFENKNRIY